MRPCMPAVSRVLENEAQEVQAPHRPNDSGISVFELPYMITRLSFKSPPLWCNVFIGKGTAISGRFSMSMCADTSVMLMHCVITT